MLEKERYLPTLEGLLMRRLEKIFEAQDSEDSSLFDEILEEMEMLLALKPPAYNEIMAYKNELLGKANAAINEAMAMAEYANNEIQKRKFVISETEGIEWDTRKDYLEMVVNVMGKNQMIPFEKPIVAEIDVPKYEPVEEATVEEALPPPIPEKKPHIKSAKKVQNKSAFEV